MWRIYSPNGDNFRIRVRILDLLETLYDAQSEIPGVSCYLGKVQYFGEKKLKEYANNTFDDSGITVENIFKSLLVKRRAFIHENEIRLLYDEISNDFLDKDIYSYKIDPHALISQIMIDPRNSNSKANELKAKIKSVTGYEGSIKRSLLYTLPKQLIVNVTNT